jgi:hypothetical protein
MHLYGPLLGVRKNFKKAYPYRNLHYRISIQLLLRNPTVGASIGEPRALTYTSRIAYVSYA